MAALAGRDVVTPRPRASLGDLTNTLSTPSPIRHSQRRVPPATAVQRFSVRSRRAPPAGERHDGLQAVAWAHQELLPPPGLSGGVVRLCPCSWKRALDAPPAAGARRRRMCQRDTEEHAEFQLLQAMARRFRDEAKVPPLEDWDQTVAGKASIEELEVDFILQPGRSSGTVVGYVALGSVRGGRAPKRPHPGATPTKGSPKPVVLAQLYVEPEFRRCGVATAALSVILARRHMVVVGGGSTYGASHNASDPMVVGMRAAVGVLARLGFQQVAPAAVSDEFGLDAGTVPAGHALFVKCADLRAEDNLENMR